MTMTRASNLRSSGRRSGRRSAGWNAGRDRGRYGWFCVVFAAAALVPFSGVVARASAEAPVVILCLGDSLTEGYGIDPQHAYPAVLERRLREAGHSVEVVNAGISGATSASGPSRLRWQLRARPDIMILELGANDALRGVDLASTRRNLARTIAMAKTEGVLVVLAGMQIPTNYGPAYTRDFRELFPSLAKQYDVALIPFFLEGVAARPDLNLPDGIHPTAEGYLRVVDNVVPVLAPLIGKRESGKGESEAAAGG